MKAEHSLAALCAAFAVKHSGYHAWVKAEASPRERTDAALLPKIRAVFARHKGRYDSPRIQDELAGQGARHGGKRIARLMKAAGLRGRCSRRFVPRTPHSDHDHPIAPNLLARRPAPIGPDQTWVTDLTYVRTDEGWLYVAVLLDLWSRRVVGWATAAMLHADLATRALQMALQHRRPSRGLLHHSDRGVQYASGPYRERLKAGGLEPSMSRAANPYDNAVMESFHATYKRECVGLAEAGGTWRLRHAGRGNRRLLRLRRKILQPAAPPQCPRLSNTRGLRKPTQLNKTCAPRLSKVSINPAAAQPVHGTVPPVPATGA